MEKNLDSKGRWRNKIVAFRVSPEEAEQIDACVRLSGLSKQDYITKRLTDRQIVVQGNPRVYKALRNQMAEIYEELKHLEDNLRVPSGASYPMIARELCRRCSPETFKNTKLEDNRDYAGLLKRTMDFLYIQRQQNRLIQTGPDRQYWQL